MSPDQRRLAVHALKFLYERGYSFYDVEELALTPGCIQPMDREQAVYLALRTGVMEHIWALLQRGHFKDHYV